jgi:hypothetical protein
MGRKNNGNGGWDCPCDGHWIGRSAEIDMAGSRIEKGLHHDSTDLTVYSEGSDQRHTKQPVCSTTDHIVRYEQALQLEQLTKLKRTISVSCFQEDLV